MKKKIIMVILLFSVQLIGAQNKIDSTLQRSEIDADTLIYNTTGLEVQPEFPGGIEKFHNFFNLNFKIPEGEVVKDKIVTMFIIEKDGSLSNLKVLRGGLNTKKEAIRVLKMAPKWIPGIQNGKIVRVLYAVNFPVKTVSKKEHRKK